MVAADFLFFLFLPFVQEFLKNEDKAKDSPGCLRIRKIPIWSYPSKDRPHKVSNESRKDECPVQAITACGRIPVLIDLTWQAIESEA